MCFFFNDTATTEIYTLSLHDALPIFASFHGSELPVSTSAKGTSRTSLALSTRPHVSLRLFSTTGRVGSWLATRDRKSTRLNSSHANISYAVFCLKKKKRLSTLECHSP